MYNQMNIYRLVPHSPAVHMAGNPRPRVESAVAALAPGRPGPRQQQTLKAAWMETVLAFALLLLMIFLPHHAQSATSGIDTSEDHWALLAGYGQSIPGWGLTTQRVEVLDLIPRYNHVIFGDLGSGWYRGAHSLLVELPLSLVLNPENSAMIAANFLAAYTFTAERHWRPYLFAGGGPVYSFADIPGMGSELNGNYQFGIGLQSSFDRQHTFSVEMRYHHISNGGSEDPNDPLNSFKLLIGVTF